MAGLNPDFNDIKANAEARVHYENAARDKAARVSSRAPPPRYSDVYSSGPLHRIIGVRLPCKPRSTLWDLSISDGKIASIEPFVSRPHDIAHLPGVLVGTERLLAPSLCHAHIHLDKCFLLQDPKFLDLEIETGDFTEAMELTTQAKSRFEEDDLLRRGRQLIEESIHFGVTVMRAFVEVDGDVQFKCLDAGLKLKKEFKERCEVQLCAFAQLPLFSGDDGGEKIRDLMSQAAHREGVDVVGSTPYVEQDEVKMKMNIRWISMMALFNGKPLDLHLDYNLEKSKDPLIWSALEILKGRNWTEREGKGITLGHCTRLTLFSPEDWRKLKEEIGDLPVSFVGLPTSDLFMMRAESRARGTLPIPEMIEEYKLDGAIAVNNVGNAFTPQGNCDPLSVASLGVAIYQAGTKKDAEVLYECVSSRAKAVIGVPSTSLDLAVGDPADFVLFDRLDIGWRCRTTITEVVYDAGPHRQTIWQGKLTTL
ncbi:cytosine deaminase protein-like protein [Mytilinidion resinicola]|uniref:Cytosine deaminase protein-like protein n=1 Tax=Mytilinidion resinicola TaxID=574789 RepID=A0A6A6YVU5_9PEZI|nr:cytosine deaminase protein-like protein [Mytilinidion resinicola]KAF2812639.1 cytosine deaminase protein-like protein [Mytilinidion resinicola]